MEETKLRNINHLSTKSSVFHPTQLASGGQQEIFRHMKRHYDRLGRVTAATDTTPPKSYTSSTLARDREKKHNVVDTFKMPVTSKFIEGHMKLDVESELISLPTKDSDIQSILRHVPELRKSIKFRTHEISESHTSLGTKELEVMAGYQTDNQTRGGNSLGSPKGRIHNANAENINNTNITIGTTEHDMELKYLKFVSDITREILVSSISSDRALKMLFERHIAQKRGALNESIMRMRIEELKIKLSIKS